MEKLSEPGRLDRISQIEVEGPRSRRNHVCMWRSLEHSGGAAGQLRRGRTGVGGLQERMAHLQYKVRRGRPEGH